MDPLATGRVIGGRFELGRKIAESAQATTWVARDREEQDEECVVKVLREFPATGEDSPHMRQEVEALRAARHPHLVRFRDLILEPETGLAAIVTDRVSGRTLADVLAGGALPRSDVLRILVDCARGLGSLHDRGLVHRDLHSRNVVVHGAAGSRSAVVVDLGLAALFAQARQGGVVGTLGFMAPEAVSSGVQDPRSDLYSLGCLLFHMVVGEPPVQPRELVDELARGGDPFARIEERVIAQVPEPFQPVATRLLSRYPAARYQSAADLVHAVNLRFGTAFPVEAPESRLPVLTDPPLVGRVAEKKALLRALAEDPGSRPVILVSGNRGLGKTRLVESALRVLEFRGRPILRLRPPRPGAEGGGGLDAAAESIRHRLRAAGAPEGTGGGASLLEDAAAVFPDLIVTVDDLDRLDTDAADALARFAAAGRGPGSVVAVLPDASGPARAGPLTRLLRLLTGIPGAQRIEVGPLAPAAAEQLVTSVLPVRNLSTHSVRRIVEAGQGNPAHLLEVLRALLEGGRVTYGPDGWVLRSPGKPLPLPASAAEAVERRLFSLGEGEREILAGLSRVGDAVALPAWDALLRTLPAHPPPDRFLRGLVRVDPGGHGVRLSTEALRTALSGMDGPELRGRAARRWLAALPDPAALGPVGATLLRLDAGETANSLLLAGAAVAELRRVHRLEDAQALVEALLPAVGPGASGGPALDLLQEAVSLGIAQWRFGDALSLAQRGRTMATSLDRQRSFAALICEAEAGSGVLPGSHLDWLDQHARGTEAWARGRLAKARAHFVRGQVDPALELVEEVLPVLEEHPALHIRALNGKSALFAEKGRLSESRANLDQALGIARRIGDRTAEVALLGNLARTDSREGRYRLALRSAVLGIQNLNLQTSDADEASLLMTCIGIEESLGRWRRARAHAERLATLSAEFQNRTVPAGAFQRWGKAEGRLGNPEEALRLFTLSLRVGFEAGLPAEISSTRLALATFHLDRGETGASLEALTDSTASEGQEGIDPFPRSVLRLRLEGGPPGRHLEAIRTLLATQEGAAWPDELRHLRRMEVEALLDRGEEKEAGDRLDTLIRDCRRCGAADPLARALVLSGRVHAADPGRAEAGMRRAARLAFRLEDLLLRATVLETCGGFFAGRPGEEAFVRRCLGEAASLFAAAGLPGRAEALRPRETSSTDTGSSSSSPTSWKGLQPDGLAWVLEQTDRLHQADDPEDVLAGLLDAALAFTGAERGFLVLREGDGFTVRLARSMDVADIDPEGRDISTSLIRTALEKGESLVAGDAREDDRFEAFFSVRNLQLRSVLVVPIKRGARILGAFYLDNRFLRGVFTDSSRWALELLASQAALAFENVSVRRDIGAMAARLQERVEDQSREIEGIRRTVRGVTRKAKFEYGEIFRGAGAMAETLLLVDRAVEAEIPILLEGESGTGKELVARAIHFHGRRKDRPYIVLNCAAIPENLIESELFGHRKGAFTGAHEHRSGLIEQADGGTLFLDEIGEMPLAVQPKLLRAVQFGEFTPLGSTVAGHSSFRLVTATNRELRAMVEEGTFRKDLYFRVAVFPIRVPSLRERVEDVPELALLLLRRYAHEAGRGPRRLSREAVMTLVQHDWPGNVRELENVLRRAALMAPGDTIRPVDLALHSPSLDRATGLLQRLPAAVKDLLGEREELALRRMADHGSLTLREFAQQARVSLATSGRCLSGLVKLGVFRRVGATRSSRYELDLKWRDELNATGK